MFVVAPNQESKIALYGFCTFAYMDLTQLYNRQNHLETSYNLLQKLCEINNGISHPKILLFLLNSINSKQEQTLAEKNNNIKH